MGQAARGGHTAMVKGVGGIVQGISNMLFLASIHLILYAIAPIGSAKPLMSTSQPNCFFICFTHLYMRLSLFIFIWPCTVKLKVSDLPKLIQLTSWLSKEDILSQKLPVLQILVIILGDVIGDKC